MFKIISDKSNYLVIDKPAGLLVHAAPGNEEKTLAHELLEKYPNLKIVGDAPDRPGIVHRLDRDVSGLLVIAKTKPMFLELKRQFQAHEVLKEYTALVHGILTPKQEHGLIDKPIGRHGRAGRMAAHTQNLDKDRTAKTEYWVIKRFRHHTLLRVRIHTGRPHQIRVHLFSLGYPVVGDKLYHQKRIKPALIDRIFLHAARLGFRDLGGEYREYESKLPEELKSFLQTLH